MNIAGKVAVGDLSTHIDASGKDETAMLIQALQNMNDQRLTIVSDIRAGSDTTAVAVVLNQISSGNIDLSSRTEQQASSLEETASVMEQMTATVQHNAENAREANQLIVSQHLDGGQSRWRHHEAGD